LTRLTLRDVADFTALDYVRAGYWRGHGEPYETRKISLVPGPGGKAIRFAGGKQETLSQWHAAESGALYAGTARVRAKVSPGNMTFLIVTFLDAKGQYIGLGSIDRLPVGDWNEPVDLAVLVRAAQRGEADRPRRAGAEPGQRRLCGIRAAFAQTDAIRRE